MPPAPEEVPASECAEENRADENERRASPQHVELQGEIHCRPHRIVADDNNATTPSDRREEVIDDALQRHKLDYFRAGRNWQRLLKTMHGRPDILAIMDFDTLPLLDISLFRRADGNVTEAKPS